jgi:hypothetical protein
VTRDAPGQVAESESNGVKDLACLSIDRVVATNSRPPELGLLRGSRVGQAPAWIPEPGQYASFEVDALWDRFGDRLATCALIGFYEQRVEFYEGTPMDQAMRKIDDFFCWFAKEGQAHELDSAAPPFTKDDYAKLDSAVLERLARRAFEYLHREATS